MTAAPVIIRGLNYWYGHGDLRRQVLFDIDADIHPGEIVILTGPSGSGKTTLLTLVGALRTSQQGSLKVLGHELSGASEARLAEIRQRIGYIFQSHNLLEALTAQQNVQVTLQLHPEFEGDSISKRAAEVLTEVGLGDRLDAHPNELSGGERQRVAIARALAVKPGLLLADEPTASLDRETGRSVVVLLQQLAKRDGVSVVLVTHDSRILDIADRILTLEDGRLSSLMNAVASGSQQMLHLLAEDLHKGHLVSRIADMERSEFLACLAQVTDETRGLLEIADLVQGEAFGNVEHQVVYGIEEKLKQIFDADQSTLYFIDPDDEKLRSYHTVAPDRRRETRTQTLDGVPGHVLRSGESLNVLEGEISSDDPAEARGRTLAVPVRDSEGQTFGVIELRKKREGYEFSDSDQAELEEIATSLGTLLESWWRMGCGCRRAALGRGMSCCPPAHDVDLTDLRDL